MEEGCQGCSMVLADIPFTCALSHQKNLKPSDVLFVTDSYLPEYFYPSIFGGYTQAQSIIDRFCKDLGVKYSVATASKCPTKDLLTQDIKICRKYLLQDIEIVKPKLIITLGNLAMHMLLGKSGVQNKRGLYFEYEGIPVAPTYSLIDKIFDPVTVTNDIYIAINVHVKGAKGFKHLDFDLLWDIDDINNRILEFALKDKVAVDIESEGLSFLHDKILTVAFTAEGLTTIVIPVHHFEYTEDGNASLEAMRPLLEDPCVEKIFQNADFDLKFFMRSGIFPKNVGDTMMHQFLKDENNPRGLRDMCRRYFPDEMGE